jgi:hypothetical protein
MLALKNHRQKIHKTPSFFLEQKRLYVKGITEVVEFGRHVRFRF